MSPTHSFAPVGYPHRSPNGVPAELPGSRPISNPGTVGGDDLRRLAQLTADLKSRIRTLLNLRAGQRVLDVGCGTGGDTAAVARSVGGTGRAAGIDYDEALIREARTADARTGSSPHPWLLVADAAAIPYRAAAFDGCYCERVLQHVFCPAAVVREIVRVTRPGGAIVIADTDWATLSIDAPDREVERALVRFTGDSLHNGYAGRQLRRVMTAAGIVDVHVEAWPLVWTDYGVFRATSLSLLDMPRRAVQSGVISCEELALLHTSLLEADRRGEFFASGTLMLAHGRRPGESSASSTHQEAL